MSTHLLVSVDQVSQASFVDASPHRADLVPVYNRYTRTSADPTYDRSNDGRVAVLRPLFLGAFLFADFLIEHGLFGAQSVIVSSASSKTALAFASLVSERHSDRCEVIGLTSRNRTAFVEGTGYYRRALGYDQIAALASGAPSLFVDFAGNRTVVDAVHRKIGAHLKYSASLGVTHWDRTGEAQELPGPAPSSFSASHWASKRVADWGASGLQVRAADAMRQFLATARWLRIVNENGEAAVEARYRAALDDKIDPAQGCVLSLNPPREDCQR